MNDLKKAYRTTAHIGLWMMGGVFLQVVAVELIKRNVLSASPAPAVPGTALIRNVFFGAAAGVFFLIRAVNRRVLSGRSPVQSKSRAVRYAPDILRLMSASIITFAFCELAAILGLVLFLVIGNDTDFYLFVLASLFFFSVHFPQYGKWEGWMKDRSRQGAR